MGNSSNGRLNPFGETVSAERKFSRHSGVSRSFRNGEKPGGSRAQGPWSSQRFYPLEGENPLKVSYIGSFLGRKDPGLGDGAPASVN